jgi:hypothetical protein
MFAEHPEKRFFPAIAAGTIAIVVNTLALKLADVIQLATAHGGLLRLISPCLSPLFHETGISALWRGISGPLPGTPIFQTGFHLAVGEAMAIFYAYLLEPYLPGSPLAKGLLYALGVWLLNALVRGRAHIVLRSSGGAFREISCSDTTFALR